ncbi:MAG TPA: thermonuclease family protein [Hyphomicrobium sp.]|nr:thermonuclease family protein [Hyphomicrobium sp.]
MAKRGKVVRFRKRPAKARRFRRGPFASVGRLVVPAVIVGLLLAAAGVGLIEGKGPGASRPTGTADNQVVRVTWVDGDSGRLDDREFRLHGVDAPEGSPQRAKCARERTLSGDARNAARSITEGKTVRVAGTYGPDTYGREIVDLSAGGKDVADQLVASGKLKRWNFDGGERKPDWCG